MEISILLRDGPSLTTAQLTGFIDGARAEGKTPEQKLTDLIIKGGEEAAKAKKSNRIRKGERV